MIAKTKNVSAPTITVVERSFFLTVQVIATIIGMTIKSAVPIIKSVICSFPTFVNSMINLLIKSIPAFPFRICLQIKSTILYRN